MHSPAYTHGFMDKLAEMNKSAKQSVYADELDKFFKQRDEELGVPKRKPYRQGSSPLSRAKEYAGSLGRGLAAAGGAAALRTGENLFTLATWVPELADSLILGKMLGVDEGRGALGRALGNFHRSIDRKVHGLRNWSDKYDYEHRIPGHLNKFLHGAGADVLGGFAGWGGVGSLLRKSTGGLIGGTLGGTFAMLGGRESQLRDRERWMRGLHPSDRARVDPTSTAINQELAPTLSEYRRYHMPSIGLPTSATGYINIPYRWWHTSSGAPTQFRAFGT
jgi:hypothetical protein